MPCTLRLASLAPCALQALQNFPSVGYSLARCRLEKFCIRRLWLCKVQALQNFAFVGYVLTRCNLCKILPSWVTGLQGASLAKFCLRESRACKVQALQNFGCVGHGLARCKPCIWVIFDMWPGGVLFYPD